MTVTRLKPTQQFHVKQVSAAADRLARHGALTMPPALHACRRSVL